MANQFRDALSRVQNSGRASQLVHGWRWQRRLQEEEVRTPGLRIERLSTAGIIICTSFENSQMSDAPTTRDRSKCRRAERRLQQQLGLRRMRRIEVPPSATTKNARPCVRALSAAGLCLSHNLINALLRIRLAHTSARCDHVRYVSAVARWDICVYAEIRFPRPQDLSRVTLDCRVGCVNSRAVVRCGCCRPKQLINIDLRRVHGLCRDWGARDH